MSFWSSGRLKFSLNIIVVVNLLNFNQLRIIDGKAKTSPEGGCLFGDKEREDSQIRIVPEEEETLEAEAKEEEELYCDSRCLEKLALPQITFFMLIILILLVLTEFVAIIVALQFGIIRIISFC